MKILLAVLTLFLASAARAELPCRLTDDDFDSLATSSSRVTRQSVQSLSPARQQDLCRTRAFLKTVDASGGRIQRAEKYSPTFLSPDEKARVSNAVDDLIQRQLANSGVVIV